MFDRVRPVGWGFIVLALATSWCLVWFINAVVFPSQILLSIQEHSANLVQQTLIVNLFQIAVIVGCVLFGLGGLRGSDLGLVGSRVKKGLFYAFAFWVFWQTVLLLIGLLGTGVRISPRWRDQGATVIVGALVAQLFGTAPQEEVLYRGFLFPQLFLQLRPVPLNRRVRAALALVVSAVLFALMHVPAVIGSGRSVPVALSRLTIGGVLAALQYLYSRNLYFVIGLHALGNWNMPLFEIGVDSGLVFFLLSLIVVLVWSVVIAVGPSCRLVEGG